MKVLIALMFHNKRRSGGREVRGVWAIGQTPQQTAEFAIAEFALLPRHHENMYVETQL